MNAQPVWRRLDLRVEIEPPLEVRAEPDGRGGWRVRCERTQGGPGTTLFGWLQAMPQAYEVRIGDDTGTAAGYGA